MDLYSLLLIHGHCEILLGSEVLLLAIFKFLLLPRQLSSHGGRGRRCLFGEGRYFFGLRLGHSKVVLQESRFLFIGSWGWNSFLGQRFVFFGPFPFYTMATIILFLFSLFFLFLWWVPFDGYFDFFFLRFAKGDSVVIDFGFGHALVLCEVNKVGFLIEGSNGGVGEVFSGAFFEEGARLFFAFF